MNLVPGSSAQEHAVTSEAPCYQPAERMSLSFRVVKEVVRSVKAVLDSSGGRIGAVQPI
jgi:hypothetical protein